MYPYLNDSTIRFKYHIVIQQKVEIEVKMRYAKLGTRPMVPNVVVMVPD